MFGNSCDTVRKGQARKLGTTRRSVSGFVSLRNGAFVGYESKLERDFLAKTNSNLAVLDIIPQPVSIPFSYPNGRAYEYTPDFLVYYRLENGYIDNAKKPMLVEVKEETSWRENWRKWLPKWKAAWRYAKENGYSFHIMDESRIRDTTLLNVEFLSRYKRMIFDVELTSQILIDTQQHGHIAFSTLLGRHYSGVEQASGISHLWYLLATRQLDCDLSLPLTNDTNLWMPTYG